MYAYSKDVLSNDLFIVVLSTALPVYMASIISEEWCCFENKLVEACFEVIFIICLQTVSKLRKPWPVKSTTKELPIIQKELSLHRHISEAKSIVTV